MTHTDRLQQGKIVKLVHPSDDQFVAYLKGTLDGQLQEAVAEHFRVCFVCRNLMEIAQEGFRKEADIATEASQSPITEQANPAVRDKQAESQFGVLQWLRNRVEELAALIANTPDRCMQWNTSVRLVPSSASAAGGTSTDVLRMMGPGEERHYEASFPNAVRALSLPEQFDTLKVVLEDERGSTAKMSLLLEPDLLAEGLPSRVVEVRAEVRDRTGRLLARLPLVLQPGIQNRSRPVSVRLGSDPGDFEGTLSVVLCEVLAEVPFDDGE